MEGSDDKQYFQAKLRSKATPSVDQPAPSAANALNYAMTYKWGYCCQFITLRRDWSRDDTFR